MRVYVVQLCLLVARSIIPVTSQQRTGYEMNAASCIEADQKNVTIGFHASSTEFLYGSPSLDGIPQDCLPTNLDVYGAWYKMFIPGSIGTELETKFYTQKSPGAGAGIPHSLSVMEGGCGDDLKCTGFSAAVVPDGEQATVTFTLSTNIPYYVFFAVERVPNAFVPPMTVELANPRAECNFYRSEQQTMLSSQSSFGGPPGVCMPCQESSTADENGGTTTSWTTTCFDKCQHCYPSSLSTGGGTFCYRASRKWTKSVSANDGSTNEILDIRNCYTFEDGSKVCDNHGPEYNANICSLEINDVACESCERNFNLDECDIPNQPYYGAFKANCSNLRDGSGVMIRDNCQKIGFDSTSVLTNYGIMIDTLLSNSSQLSLGDCGSESLLPAKPSYAFPPTTPDQSTTTNMESSSPISIELDDTFGPFDVSNQQILLFVLDTANTQGILTCAVDGNNGDVDLAIGLDVAPTGEVADCRSNTYDSMEQCSVIVYDGVNQVYVQLYGYSPTTGVSLECRMTEIDDAEESFDLDDGDFSINLEVGEDEYLLYEVKVPERATRMSCGFQLEEGDLALFMRANDLPIPYMEWRYDCFTNSSTSAEGCKIFEGIKDESVYVLLMGFEHENRGLLSCSVSTEEIGMGKTVASFDLGEHEERLFYIEVPEGTMDAWCNIAVTSFSANVYFYMRHGHPPTHWWSGGEAVHDSQGYASLWSGGPEDTTRINGQEAWSAGGRVYALVHSMLAAEGITVTCDALTLDDAQRIEVDGGVTTFDIPENEPILVFADVPETTDNIECYADDDSPYRVDMIGNIGHMPHANRMLDDNDCSYNPCIIRDLSLSDEKRIYIRLTGYNNAAITAGVNVWCESVATLASKQSNPDLP